MERARIYAVLSSYTRNIYAVRKTERQAQAIANSLTEQGIPKVKVIRNGNNELCKKCYDSYTIQLEAQSQKKPNNG